MESERQKSVEIWRIKEVYSEELMICKLRG